MTRIRSFLLFALAATVMTVAMLACQAEPTPIPTAAPAPTLAPTPTPKPTPKPTPPPVPRNAGDSLVPEGATFIIDADPSAILGSRVMAPLLAAMLGGAEAEEGLFGEFERKTGIAISSVTRAELFMDVETVLAMGLEPKEDDTGPPPTIGVVLRGDLDEADFASRLALAKEEDPAAEYVVDSYRGYTMYVDADEDPEKFSFAFAEADTLVLGTTDAVEQMLDVASGASQPATGVGIGALESLGDRDFGMIMVIPPEVLAATMQADPGELGLLSSFGPGALAPLTVMKMSVDDASMVIESRQIFGDENAAAAAKEFNEGTITLMGAMSGSPELQALFGSIQIGQSGSEVTFNMALDAASVTSLLAFMELFMQLGAG